MGNRYEREKFTTAAACRHKATSLRTLAMMISSAASRDKMNAMAEDWDKNAMRFDNGKAVEA